MLTYLRSSIFDSPAQTLVNTVNTVGVMGKGVAKEYKSRFPEMYKEYRSLCDTEMLKIGLLHLWRGSDKWVLNFPTKTTWRKPSRLEYVEAGLKKFRRIYEDFGITSISFPPLGCGNGNLEWDDVRPMMEYYLKDLPIRVLIHDRQVSSDYVPEHFEDDVIQYPISYDNFLGDVKASLFKQHGVFYTLGPGTQFDVKYSEKDGLAIMRNKKSDFIPEEEFQTAWSVLQNGILSADQYSGENSRRYKSYLFAVLASLPYVGVAEVQHIRGGNNYSGYGLFFMHKFIENEEILGSEPDQGELWQYQ